jgi:hypothetical protein
MTMGGPRNALHMGPASVGALESETGFFAALDLKSHSQGLL